MNNTIKVIKFFTEHTKTFCVLGVLLTDEGIRIANEMLTWLLPKYDVYVVEQEMPGDLFEYPAINYAIELSKSTFENCLYVHTKGAAIWRPEQRCIRNMWKSEFADNKKQYDILLNEHKGESIIFCPLSGADKNTWFNGFIITPEAAINTQPLSYTPFRWYWESMYRKNNKVKVYGRLINDIKDVNDENNIGRLLKYVMTKYE